MRVEIKHRYTEAVLFAADVPDDTPSGLQTRVAMEQATEARANLAGANLAGANLARAELAGANLTGANLTGANLARAKLACANLASANLARADLARANLAGANLARAELAGANLTGANLTGAKLSDELTLIGRRPLLQIGPIGSRSDTLHAYITSSGVYLRAGCFFGTRAEFAAAVERDHGANEHGDEYRAALVLIDAHARLWTPATQEVA